MAIHNKSHHNHALMTLNKGQKNESMKYKSETDFEKPEKIKLLHSICDCEEFLAKIPDDSVQLICVDPPYNLELTGWDIYDDYIDWAAKWIDEACWHRYSAVPPDVAARAHADRSACFHCGHSSSRCQSG